MKKILSVILAVFILSTMLSTIALADETDLFDVAFDSMSEKFTVSASKGLTGINRVLLVVKDSADEVIYMDAMNNALPQNVYFSVDLGNSLEEAEYTFILSSDGHTRSSQTKTCRAELEETESFFDVTYIEEGNKFVVTGEVKKDGAASVNRLLLMVYDPMFNGYSDLCYMDALNSHKGEFTFEVPLDAPAPVGTYTFVISSDGDVVTKGTVNYAITDNFETYGSIGQGTTFGGIYTMEDGEVTPPTVIIALYKTNDDGSKTLVDTAVSSEAVEGKVTAEITIAADEDVRTYSAKAFVWDNLTTSLKPIKTGRSFR